MNLYEISKEFAALDEMLLKDEGEITESYEQLESYMNELLVKKTQGMIEFVKREKDRIEIAKERIKQLRQFITVQENKLERIDNYVATCMTSLKKSKIESELGSITLRKPTKVVKITDQDKIPAKYKQVETTVKVHKMLLKKSLLTEEVEGCELVDSEKKSLIYK